MNFKLTITYYNSMKGVSKSSFTGTLDRVFDYMKVMMPGQHVIEAKVVPVRPEIGSIANE